MQRRVFLPLLAAPFSGCRMAEVGPERTENRVVPMDGTEMLTAELRIGAGEVRIDTDTSQLLDATFRYNVDEWKPKFRYNNVGFRGHLTIEQPSSGKAGGNTKYEWDLHFSPKKPLDLRMHFGAGEADVRLGAALVRGIEINMGVGELKLDLRGEPERGYPVRINGGVGEATVHLPASVNIDARARGGIGNISAKGLRKEGERWVNENPSKSRAWIRLDIHGGVGAINLIAD